MSTVCPDISMLLREQVIIIRLIRCRLNQPVTGTSGGAATVALELCNTPTGHLTATGLAETANELGRMVGFEVEVFDKVQIIEMACGDRSASMPAVKRSPASSKFITNLPGSHPDISGWWEGHHV